MKMSSSTRITSTNGVTLISLMIARRRCRRLPTATTGSAAPFVGLFGTVVGIINSFGNIGQSGSASLAVVAPGIAEALIATAVGLAAAIPATIFYNHFVGALRRLSVSIELFSAEFQTDLRSRGARSSVDGTRATGA